LIQGVKQIDINQFDYPLPAERIAVHPLEKRDESKLLVYAPGGLQDHQYTTLPALLPDGSRLVFNQTRVVQARLYFAKNEQTTIEVFCLEPWEAMPLQLAMEAKNEMHYRCMIGGAKKWKQGTLSIEHKGIVLRAEKLEAEEGVFRVAFSWDADFTFAEMLELMGRTPLPPYMKRASEASDKDRYQTVYAKQDGSVAAPTAGLHFTPELLQRLRSKGMEQHFLTLHVGAGTFKPVSADALEDHIMHAEEFFVEQAFIQNCLESAAKGPVVCVGTTSLRALESTYWLGCMLKHNPQLVEEELFVPQWIAYEGLVEDIPLTEALQTLLLRMQTDGQNFLRARTQIIIAPGYAFKVAGGLLTNLHQPRSTLLLLVAAIIGDDWKKVYTHALENNYRFLSYGDGAYLPIEP
jgi:S-adenosylmethionine:tRNA ribosyltransferase-isomerase